MRRPVYLLAAERRNPDPAICWALGRILKDANPAYQPEDDDPLEDAAWCGRFLAAFAPLLQARSRPS